MLGVWQLYPWPLLRIIGDEVGPVGMPELQREL